MRRTATIKDAATEIHGFVTAASSRDCLSMLRCCVFTLFHSSLEDKERAQVCVDGLAESIEALDALTDDARFKASERIVARFIRQAQSVTDQNGRPQRFIVVGYNTTELDGAHIDQCTFRLDPSPDAVDEVDGSDLNDKGALALSFKWNETLGKQSIDAFREARTEREYQGRRFDHILELTMQRNAILENKLLEMTNQLQDALDRKATRDADAHKLVIETNRDERMWQLFETILARATPVIMDRLGAGPATNLFRSFKPEEIKMLAASLPPERKALLYEVCDKYLGLNLLERAKAAEHATNGVAALSEGNPDHASH